MSCKPTYKGIQYPNLEAVKEIIKAEREALSNPIVEEKGQIESYLTKINKAKKENPSQYWSVDVPSYEVVKEAAENNRLVDVNGGMGIVTADGNMVGLFKYDDTAKGTAKSVQEARILKGGIKLDNFDGYLTKTYEKNGFRIASRVKFNEEVAPKEWNKKDYGTPDVVFMIYDPQGKLNIQEKLFEKDEYEQAQSYRDSFVEEARKNIVRKWDESKGSQTLPGAPIVEGVTGADPELTYLAEEYARRNGIDYKRQPKYVEVDEERAKKIAEEYDKMEHNPQDPVVKEAYENLIKQTVAQYEVLKEAGYKFYFFDEKNDPYNGNPYNAMRDLRSNKTMGVFLTEAGFGSEGSSLNVEDNPLLADTGLSWGYGSVEGEKRKVLANDLFRAVHDAFGHGLEGSGFRARGEENAWQSHVRLFTGSAVGAITSETRGQNSWLNYGKFGEQNKTAKVEDTIFADQKTGLMPEWTWTEGIDSPKPLSGGAAFAKFFAKITDTKDGGAKYTNVKEVLNKSIEGYEKELEAYLKYGKNFQKHIMTSIPAFVDARIRVLKGMTEAAVILGKGKKEVNMLDITSSEGYFTKAWAQLAQDKGVNAKADALDAGVSFQRDFKDSPQVPGVDFLLQAWGESFVDPSSGITIPLFTPTKKYEVVFEGMGFQFFTPTREKEISEVKGLMEKDGLFVTMQKFKNADYEKREVLKDEFKSQFFTKEELAQKASTVLKKSDEASVGMMDYQFDRLEYEKVLSNNFKYVVQFYSAGNFAGYLATDSLEVINATMEATGDTTTKFNEEVTPNIIKGTGIGGSFQETSEPKATFNGFETYAEAVKNTPINETIKVDIEGVSVAEITNSGDINDLIRQDIITDQRELSPNGDVVFITKGNSLAKKIVNAEIAREIVKGRVNEQGNIVSRQKVELTEASNDFNKNKKEFGEDAAITILASKIIADNTPAFGNNRIIDYSVEIPSENVLMTKLKNLMQELGIKTMSLETWKENYEKRTGSQPTSSALADISNRIIAFANGEVTQDALSEEVMHFVIEALPQEQLQPLLDMIHKTEEWKEYSQQYMEIYKDEAIVRREILGKVLKNYIQNQQEQPTLQGQSITRRLVELLDKFFAQIRGLFKPKHQTQLDNFKEEIYQKLMAEELYSELSPEQFDGNKMVMYQTGTSPLYNSLTKAVETFRGLDKITGNNFQYQLDEVQLKEFDNLNQLKSASGLATTIRNHIAHLDKRGKQKGFLSTEETLVYQTIEKELQPALGMVSAVLRQEEMGVNSSLQKRVLAEIEDTNNQVDRLINDLKREKQERFKELAEQAARESGLTDNMKDILIKEMQTLDRDTNQFYALFGGLAHAQNPILNILATVMSGVNRESNLQFTKRQNELLNIANRLGFKDEEVAQVLKKFKDDYYFLSPYDFTILFLEEAKIKAGIYKDISGEEVAPEEFVKTEEEFKIKLTQDQLKDYLFQTTESIRKSGLYIDVLKKEERKKIEDLTDNFSPKTKNLLNQLSARKRKVFKRAQDNGGLSSEDNYELQQIMYDQQKLSSPYDENGDLFEGLTLNDENDVDLAENTSKESLSDEVRTAYELNHYNQKRREEFSEGDTKAPMRFIEEVQKIREEQGLDKAIEFLKLNSRISYNNNFWSTFDKAGGIVEKLKENDGLELAEEIARQRVKLKNILKQHRMYNNPSQINFEEMGGTAISEVKDIVTALNGLYREAKLMLPEEVEEYTESQAETVVNEAYKNQIEDLGLDTLDKQLDFIYQHVTALDKESLQRSIINYKRYKNGDITNLPKAFTKFDSKSEEENIKEYAESKLLPYFKELKPQDLNIQEFVNNLAITKTAEEFDRLVEEARYVSVSPAYIWLDAETSDRLNPEYTKRREANEPLVNLEYKGGMLKNKRYQEYFGMSNGIATKNEKEFTLLQEVVKFQEATIDSAGMEGKHNKYQLPQFRRQNMARMVQVAKDFSVKNLKEFIKDAVTVREDDPILGQTIDGQDSKNFQRGALAVPRIGFRKLESSEEVTDEVLYSVMLMAKEAEKRKQRIGALLDIESIRTELQGKQYGDKSGESTTTYKMFDDFVRYNIYGQTETFKWETDFFGLSSKKRNLAPVIRQFQNWVRLVNLGFSVLTPMTSLLQGTTNFMVEKFVGDRIDKDAARQARKKVPKLITEAASEFLNVRAKGELNLMLQYFGLESPMERYMNSNYGKALRGTAIDKSAYFTHYMGDLPLTAQTVMTVLHDFKNVKGELINYSEWRNRNRSLVEKDARALWAKEEKTAYGYLETKDGQMEMNDEFFSEVKNAQERLNFLKNRIQTAKQEIDNQIPQDDKGQIQRHAIFSFFSLHRGFLISSLAKRMKSRHLNLYTGQQEEGTYLGVFNFLGGMVKDARKKGIKQAWLEQYKEYNGGYKKVEKNGKFYIVPPEAKRTEEWLEYASEAKRDEAYEEASNQANRMRQISLKRGFADVVVVNTLALIALLLKNVADDDDDDYGLEMLAYMNYRLATEVSGQSVALPAQVYQFLESPTVGLSAIQNSMDVFDLASDEQIKQGNYRGFNKRQAWVFKSLPLMKEYNKVNNIDRTRNSYEHFNNVYLENFTFAGAMMDNKE